MSLLCVRGLHRLGVGGKGALNRRVRKVRAILKAGEPVDHQLARVDDRLRKEVAGALRHGIPLSLILCDLDRFKSLNDTHGHPFGDEVLERAASVLVGGRSQDVACRYGGEEFAVILPGTTIQEAAEVAERHRADIEGISWPDRPGIRISASFGVADLGCLAGPASPEGLVEAADRALYQAKTSGRNRVMLADGAEWPRSIAG